MFFFPTFSNTSNGNLQRKFTKKSPHMLYIAYAFGRLSKIEHKLGIHRCKEGNNLIKINGFEIEFIASTCY